ncbi:MAG TPA: type III pantothenate kinase, partial [Bacillota bacterium]
LDGVVIGSVVPPLRAPLRELCVHYLGCEPLFVGPETTGGLRLDVEDPARVGADRIANAVAAWEKYRRALIVVDFGTATNFDVVSAEGAFIGGAIAPGVIISTEALFQRAAALARIELVRPATAIGKNTITNVQAGILFGAAGQVDGLVERIRAELGEPEAPAIATGGLASLIARESRTVTDVDPFLTLDGLRLIYQRSRRS